MKGYNAFRCYIQPFDIYGNYSGTWEDITKYIRQVGTISQDLDSADYQLGVFKNSNITLTLDNRKGLFSDVDIIQSMFKYKRNDSLVKMTYSLEPEDPRVGMSDIGDIFLSEEIQIFKGLINDESLKMSVKNESINLNVLGLESLFDRVIVPYSSLTSADDIETLIYKILNQSPINTLLTVSAININANVNQVVDDLTWLENATGKEAIDKLLLVSNSVLYIASDTVYVTSRDASATNKYTFYGQASQLGAENIVDIKNYNAGMQRVFNYFYWKDTSISSQDIDSKALNGVRVKEIDFDVYTNSVKQKAFMDALLAEFKDKKIEMELDAPLNYDTLELNLLDKVNIDYPIIYYSKDFEPPICGKAICGDVTTATLGFGLYALLIESTKYFKILKKSYNISNMTTTFKLREI